MQNPTQNAAQPAGGQEGTVSNVAWQFVVQYYTYMNDKPEQLHRFYTKNSHYLHGIEGEETTLLQGQTAIHKKFLEIQFKECKVFIHSVDAHPSANNGILVHVIGEMSNNNEPWKKFVQVFFLAEQTNGYFVLNDNFRYLKEEVFGDEDDLEEGKQTEVGAPTGGQQPQEQEQTGDSYSHTNGYRHPEVVEPAPSQPTAPIPAPIPAPVVAPAAKEGRAIGFGKTEGLPERLTPPLDPTPTPSVPEVVEPIQEEPPAPAPSAPSPATVPRKSPSPAPPSPVAAVAEPTQPPAATNKPTTQPAPTPSQQPPAPVAPAAPSAPPAPKTWASLAATNSARWGQNVAQEAKGVSAAAPQQPHAVNPAAAHLPRERPSGNTAPAPAPAAASAAADPALQPGGVGPKNIPPAQQNPSYSAALAVTTALCFVKGVTENIPQNALEQVLTSRFGPIKECEIVRNKACAFLEFRSVDSAKKAIIASLHPSAGGEGGIHLDEAKYGSPARINVETRKERGDRPPPRPRGGMAGGGGGGEGRNATGAGGSNSPGPGQGGYRTAGGGGGPRGGTPARGRGDGNRGAKP